MREIDDRYPEFARPYEPIKGRKRHGRLTGNEAALMTQRRLRRLERARRGFLTGVGILIILTVVISPPDEHFTLPPIDPIPVPIVIPDPPPIPDPDPQPDPEPIPDPEPDPDPDPNPTPDPDPKPDPKPKPSKKEKPVVDLEKQVQGPQPEGFEYPTLFFEMKLNDLKGGKATGKIYVDTGSGFHEPAYNKEHSVRVKYNPSDVTGSTWSDNISCFVDPPEGGGVAGRAKIVFDIVYKDGTKDRIETETRPIHMGNFAKVNMEYGHDGWDVADIYDPVTDTTQYTMSFDLIIDKTLVDPEEVESGASIWLEDPWINYYDHTVERFTDGSGRYHMKFTFTSDNPFPNGEYWFTPEVGYVEDSYNYWYPHNFYLYFVKNL